MLACKTGKPVIPCVILGSHKLQSIKPYLPFRWGRLYLAFGQPLYPPADIASPKQAREIMAAQLQQQFMDLYQQLLEKFGIQDQQIP